MIASSDTNHFRNADIVLVSTNCDLELRSGQKKINLKSFSSGITTLSKFVKEDVLIIIESTVPHKIFWKIIFPIFKNHLKKGY